MFEVTSNLSWRLRMKRAKYRVTVSEAANQIGISRRTLSMVESEEKKEISKTGYKKIVDWLIDDEEVKEIE